MKSTQIVGLTTLLLVLSVGLWSVRLFALAVLLGAQWFFQPIILALRNASRVEATVEAYFEDGSEKKLFPLLSTSEKGTVSLSVIVPAYKEEKRLRKMLDQTIRYLTERTERDPSFLWEIIVVDDGSTDNTYQVALSYSARLGTDKLRVLKLAQNHGKGGAIKKGMLRARGDLLLMADADGATTFSNVEKLEAAMSNFSNGGVVVGSRAHMMLDENLRRTGVRGFVASVFQAFVALLVPGGIRDTQCGFKLFSRSAAQKIFSAQKFYGWAFDCELLFLARTKFKLPVSEVDVEWVDVDGSKLSVADASLEMARDIILMSILYNFKIW